MRVPAEPPVNGNQDAGQVQSITFLEALKVEGVLSFGFSFFCVKFANYAILLQLPSFLRQELKYDPQQAANIATMCDAGNLVGGFVLGWLSDCTYSKRSPIGVLAILISTTLALYLTLFYKSIGFFTLSFIMMFFGLLLGGLHHLLCVTCSADLGQRQL